MSIEQFIRQSTDFDDETTRIMGEAFDTACAERSEASEVVREIIARRIIEAAKKGERDPVRLKRAGLVSRERE
jgi:UDP-2,3-diacylglucosamine pyrophosphatase LpxH